MFLLPVAMAVCESVLGNGAVSGVDRRLVAHHDDTRGRAADWLAQPIGVRDFFKQALKRDRVFAQRTVNPSYALMAALGKEPVSGEGNHP